jgi:hypothetical protein
MILRCSAQAAAALRSSTHLLGLVADLAHLAANEALDREESVLRVDHALALGNLQRWDGRGSKYESL